MNSDVHIDLSPNIIDYGMQGRSCVCMVCIMGQGKCGKTFYALSFMM